MTIITEKKLDHANDEIQRTYHSTDATYILPNDNVEHQRLELQHQLQLQVLGGNLFHAPLSPNNVRAMLDIGCGTGAVTHEMAHAFPAAQAYGIDLSVTPNMRPKLPNISYIQGNIMDSSDPQLPSNSFDYIFSRLLVLGMTHWKQYIERCVSLAKPGKRERKAQLTAQKAWIEMHDLDSQLQHIPSPLSSLEHLRPHSISIEQIAQRSHPTDAYYYPVPWKWEITLGKLLAANGGDFYCGRNIAALFEEAGLVDVQVMRYMMPYSQWEGLTVEERALADYLKGFVKNALPVSIRRAGDELGGEWKGEAEEAVEDLKVYADTFDGARNFLWMYVVWGRKAE